MTENINEEGRPQSAAPQGGTAEQSSAWPTQAQPVQPATGSSPVEVAQAAAEAARMAAEAAQAAAIAIGSQPGGAQTGTAAMTTVVPQIGSQVGSQPGAQPGSPQARGEAKHSARRGGLLARFGKLPSASGLGALSNPAAKPTPPVDPKIKKRRMVVIGLVMPLFMMIVMPLVMTGMFTGSGEPRHMDVALINTSNSVKDQVNDLDRDSVNKFDVSRVDNVDDAQTQLREHDIRAAYNPKTGDLYYAGANGARVTQAVTELFTQVAADDDVKLSTHDVVATTDDDKSGSTIMFLGLGALLGGFMTGMMLGLIPAPTKLRVALGIAIPAIVSTVEVIYGWATFGVFDGNAVGPWCIMFLLSISCLTFTMGGMLLAGPVWMPVAMVACSLLGMSTSGIMAPLDLINPFYGGVHPWLFSSQGFSALRDSVYFKDAGFAQPVLVMLAWAIGGIALAIIGTLRQKKQHFDAELNKVEEVETGAALTAVM